MLADMSVISLMLATSDGCSLDGDLSVPDGPVRAAAVICHPHPLYGGDRHNNVVDALFRALPPVGVAALRFDFRGVGRSTGKHGLGVDEGLDLVAALDELSSRWPALPLIAAGYSFGSMVALGAVAHHAPAHLKRFLGARSLQYVVPVALLLAMAGAGVLAVLSPIPTSPFLHRASSPQGALIELRASVDSDLLCFWETPQRRTRPRA